MRPTLEALEDRSVPAVLTVTSLADSGAGSLRSAVARANGEGAFGVGDTIQFAPYLSGTITLGTPLGLASRAGLEIDGSPTITLSGGGTSQVFQVGPGAGVSLNGLTITNGSAADGGAIFNAGSLALTGDFLWGNAASRDGGAIFNAGTLAVYASTLSYNSAAYGLGGGIFNTGGNAFVGLADSTLWGNWAATGGGIANFGNAFVQYSNLSGNRAATGGGIANFSSMYVEGATLNYNSAVYGGAVANYGGMTMSGDTVSSNTAEMGGAVANYSSLGGMTMSGDTVTANTAVQGGGIWNSGTLVMTGDNVSYNSLRLPTAYDPDSGAQPLGSGLYNDAVFGTVNLDGSTFIGNNFNPDGSFGGDRYGV
jgi:hypothetical protein